MRVPVVAILIGLFPAHALSQSLGDAAHRQATRRAAQAPARDGARAYGDEDLHRVSGAASAEPAVAGTAGDSAGDEGSPTSATEAELAVRAELDREAAERQQREQHWRLVCGTARARVTSAQRQADELCGTGSRVLVLSGG
jgi:hypothetical protein